MPPAFASPTCRCRRPRFWRPLTRPARREPRRSEAWIPAKAGIHAGHAMANGVGARLRRHDVGQGLRSQALRSAQEPMAHVTLIGNLRQFTGGVTTLEVDAATVRQLF